MTIDTLKQVRDDYMRKIVIARKVMKKAKNAYQIELAEGDIVSFESKVEELNAEIAEESGDGQ